MALHCWARRGLGCIVAAILLAAPATATAQTRGTVTASSTVVRLWVNTSEVGITVPAGTVVEIITRSEGWCWVVLPPDSNGTRRVGWIRADHLRLDGPPPPEVVPSEGVLTAAAEQARLPRPTSPPPPIPWRAHGFVQAVGGLTFANGGAMLAGGSGGIAIVPSLQVTFEAGRLWNVIPDSLQEAAERAANETELLTFLLTGRVLNIDVDAELPSDYWIGGARYIVPVTGPVRPYISGHIGVARVESDIRFTIEGSDVSQSIIGVQNLDVAERDIMWGAGGGVTFTIGRHFLIDLGYRLLRIETSEALNIQRAHVGMGFAF